MQAKRESVFVGLFVFAAAGILILTLFSLFGAFGRGQPVYRAYFNNVGGVAPGTEVRYAGGPPVGRVVSVRSDPQNPTRMEVRFRVKAEVPVKTDSRVKIASLSALGDNFLGIIPGTVQAPRAEPGSVLTSVNYTGFDDLEANINELAPQATVLLRNLNARVTELQETIRRVNGLLDANNRANLAATLASARGMLDENRPALHSTLNNLNAGSAKLAPVIDDFKKTVDQANNVLSHVDGTLMENRPDLREAVIEMRATLASASALTDQLNTLLNANNGNLDIVIGNMREITENLKEFTASIESRPSELIRSSAPREHIPGQVSKHSN